MTQQEAQAYLDGFTAGAIFFVGDIDHYRAHAKARPDVFDKIKAELREAQELVKR